MLRAPGSPRQAIALAALAVALGLIVGPASASRAQDDEPTEGIVVEGVVSINGAPAWAGIVVVIEDQVTGETCGTATTTESGSYTVALEAPCAPGVEALAVLQQVEARRTSESLSLEERAGPLTFNPVFALSGSEESELPPRPVMEEEGAAGQALVQKTSSVFDEVELLLIWLLVSGAVLLAVMAVALLIVTNRRYKFLTETFNGINCESEAQLKHWVGAVTAEGEVQQSRLKVFRWMVEGLVMSFVVIALIALGAAGKIEAQGIVSVLAAMVGYAAGRATS